MAREKVYIGRTEEKETQFGTITKLSFGPQDFEKLEAHKNASGWVNMEIKTAKDGGLYVEIDTWKPTAGATTQAGETSQNSSDSPF